MKTSVLLPNGDDMNGIFHSFILQGINPVDKFIKVHTSSNHQDLNPVNVINWSYTTSWASLHSKNSFFEIEITNNNIITLTHFSLVSRKGYCYATKFNLHIKDVFGEWKLIHTYDPGLWCGVNEYQYCDEDVIKTFELPEVINIKSFNYIIYV